MKKEQKKVNKKFKNKRSTYETSYIDYNFMNNVVRFGLETAQKMREEAYYKEHEEIFIADYDEFITEAKVFNVEE